MHEIPVKIVLCAFEQEPRWAHETVVSCWPSPGINPQEFAKVVANKLFTRYNQYPEELFTEFNEAELADLTEYRRKQNRSLSVGDFVVIGESVLRCDAIGWTVVTRDDIKCGEFHV